MLLFTEYWVEVIHYRYFCLFNSFLAMVLLSFLPAVLVLNALSSLWCWYHFYCHKLWLQLGVWSELCWSPRLCLPLVWSSALVELSPTWAHIPVWLSCTVLFTLQQFGSMSVVDVLQEIILTVADVWHRRVNLTKSDCTTPVLTYLSKTLVTNNPDVLLNLRGKDNSREFGWHGPYSVS